MHLWTMGANSNLRLQGVCIDVFPISHLSNAMTGDKVREKLYAEDGHKISTYENDDVSPIFIF